MERLFQTHVIRRQVACDPIWTLTTLDEGGLSGPVRVAVPGVWETLPGLRRYRGRGVYEQRIHAGGNLRIWLGGVSLAARVSLDGALLAEHQGAYTGFEAVARNVSPGEHILRIEADNRFHPRYALDFPNDYYAYGGIHRPVAVEEVGRAYIVSCQVTPVLSDGAWQAAAKVTLQSLADAALIVSAEVAVAGGSARREAVLKAGERISLSLTLPCPEVLPWSPEHPRLYQVSTVLSVEGAPEDDLLDRTGFREVRAEGGRILLNGEPLRLMGFNRHEEYGSFGLSVPLEAMAQDVQLLRDLGANCVRTCHYPNDPRFLDLCDEVGLLVWEEAHARGLSEERMHHPLFMAQQKACAEEMVTQHYNHPSIFVWGCLNECADHTAYGAACYREILSLLRALDGSRPVTAALLERPGGLVYGDMDIVSVNLYPQWYHQTPVAQALETKRLEIEKNGGAEKPLIVSEIGAGAVYGCHDPFGEAKWSEERQCAILEDQITAVLADARVSGLFLWQFADVRVDEEWAPRRPRTYNNKGVLNEFRQPKLAYQTVKRLFHAAGGEEAR